MRVQVDKAAKELRFIDDGVGMTEDEVKKNINQVAFSGANDFPDTLLRSLGDTNHQIALKEIGHDADGEDDGASAGAYGVDVLGMPENRPR